MSRCLDTDTLATVGQALEWDIDEPLRHLLECEACRVSVAALAGVQQALAQEAPADQELVQRIMNTMAEPGPAPADRPFPAKTVWLLNGAMAAITVLAVAGAAALRTGAPAPSWAAVGAALVVAGGYVWWEYRKYSVGGTA